MSLLERYPNARELVWLQEEPENMGAVGTSSSGRTWRIKERGYDLRHVARVESGSPATGTKAIHDQELADLMDETFTGSLTATSTLRVDATSRPVVEVAMACSGRPTLIVVMPIAAAGLRLMPRSSRKTHSAGSTPSSSQAIS